MTVTDGVPHPADLLTRRGLDPGTWPLTARALVGGRISVGGVAVTEIAERYGTPAYVLDEADVRQHCRGYRQAFPDAEIAYAAEAFLCRAMARWLDEEGLSLDVHSEGELAVAGAVGFPAERIMLTGNAKTPGDLRAAMDYGVGRIVVDSAGEIARIASLARPRQRVLVQITLDAGTLAQPRSPAAVGTGDSEPGFPLGSGAAADAVRRILSQPELQFAGLRCHLGPQTTFGPAARVLAGFMAAIQAEYGVTPPELSLGHGHGAAGPGDDQDPTGWTARMDAAVRDACTLLRLPVPRLIFEPGAAIIGRAVVTLYRVVSVRHAAGPRALVAVDGGISDNPRPAWPGACCTVRAASRPAVPAQSATVVGRHGEASDVLAADADLPAGTRPGDLVAVACTGAYSHSLASNYHLVGRPPVVAVRDGAARLLVRRETPADLRQRDVGL